MQVWQSALEHIPLGIYEKALPAEMSWPERLAAAAQAGFDYVEIAIDDTDERIARLDWTPAQRRALRQASEEAGMPILSMSLSAHRRFPLGSAVPGRRERGLEILRRAIDFASDIGLRCVLLCGADDYYEETTTESRLRFRAGLERGFVQASAAGMMLALENWDVGTNSIRKALEYVHYFNSPWFQLYADIGNLVYAGYDVIDELEAGRGHIAALHVKDTLPGQLRYVPLGEGAVPFAEAFSVLAATGFQAPVAVELWTEKFPDSVALVNQANTWLREQMQAGWRQAAAQKEQ
jgi:L-ribulose-5-phosphate 3-epimerase